MANSGALPHQAAFSVRLASQADLCLLADLMVRVHGSDNPDIPADLSPYLEAGELCAFIGEFGSDAAGCILADVSDDTVLHCLGVLLDHRGQGLGSEIIAHAISTLDALREPYRYWTAIDEAKRINGERFEKLGFGYVSEQPFPGLKLMLKEQRPLEP